MNSLTLLLYGINVLQNIASAITGAMVLLIIGTTVLVAINHIRIGVHNDNLCRNEDPISHMEAVKVYRPYAIAFICVAFLNMFVPSERTIYLMAASEVGQRVVQSEKVSGFFDPTIETLKNFVALENEKIKTELNKLSEKKK